MTGPYYPQSVSEIDGTNVPMSERFPGARWDVSARLEVIQRLRYEIVPFLEDLDVMEGEYWNLTDKHWRCTDGHWHCVGDPKAMQNDIDFEQTLYLYKLTLLDMVEELMPLIDFYRQRQTTGDK